MPCAPINHLNLGSASTPQLPPHPYHNAVHGPTYDRRKPKVTDTPAAVVPPPSVLPPPRRRMCIACREYDLNEEGTMCNSCYVDQGKQRFVSEYHYEPVVVSNGGAALDKGQIKDLIKRGGVDTQSKQVVNRIDAHITAMLLDPATRLPGLLDYYLIKSTVYDIWMRMQHFWSKDKVFRGVKDNELLEDKQKYHIQASPEAIRFPYQIAAAIRLAVQEQVLLYANIILDRTQTRGLRFGKPNASIRVPSRDSIINHFESIRVQHPGSLAGLEIDRKSYFQQTYHKGLEAMPVPISRYDMLIINMFETIEHFKILIGITTDEERNERYPITLVDESKVKVVNQNTFVSDFLISTTQKGKERREQDFVFFEGFDDKKWVEVLKVGLTLFHAQSQVPLWFEFDHIPMAVCLVLWAIQAIKRNAIPNCKKFMSALGRVQGVGHHAIDLHMAQLQKLIICWVPSIIPAGIPFPKLRETKVTTIGTGTSGYDGKPTSGIPRELMAVSAARTIADNWEAIVTHRVREYHRGEVKTWEQETREAQTLFAKHGIRFVPRNPSQRSNSVTSSQQGSDREDGSGPASVSGGRPNGPLTGLGISIPGVPLVRMDAGAGGGWGGIGMPPMVGTIMTGYGGPATLSTALNAPIPGSFTLGPDGSFSMVPAAPVAIAIPTSYNTQMVTPAPVAITMPTYYNLHTASMSRGPSNGSTGSGTTQASSVPNPRTPNSPGTPLTDYSGGSSDYHDMPRLGKDEVYPRGPLAHERANYIELERKKQRARDANSETSTGGTKRKSVDGDEDLVKAKRVRKEKVMVEGEEVVVKPKRVSKKKVAEDGGAPAVKPKRSTKKTVANEAETGGVAEVPVPVGQAQAEVNATVPAKDKGKGKEKEVIEGGAIATVTDQTVNKSQLKGKRKEREEVEDGPVAKVAKLTAPKTKAPRKGVPDMTTVTWAAGGDPTAEIKRANVFADCLARYLAVENSDYIWQYKDRAAREVVRAGLEDDITRRRAGYIQGSGDRRDIANRGRAMRGLPDEERVDPRRSRKSKVATPAVAEEEDEEESRDKDSNAKGGRKGRKTKAEGSSSKRARTKAAVAEKGDEEESGDKDVNAKGGRKGRKAKAEGSSRRAPAKGGKASKGSPDEGGVAKVKGNKRQRKNAKDDETRPYDVAGDNEVADVDNSNDDQDVMLNLEPDDYNNWRPDEDDQDRPLKLTADDYNNWSGGELDEDEDEDEEDPAVIF